MNTTPHDAFAPTRDSLGTEEAIAAMLAAIRPVEGCETVGLFEADHRVLAVDVVARRSVPPLANSAVDGYAVRTADLGAEETRLPVAGRVAAGQSLGRAIRPGEAIRIFTGAPLPEGVDAVIPQEVARPEEQAVWLPRARPGTNCRPAGEDFAAGEVVLSAGKRLGPQDCAHAAAAGHAELTVHRRPVVALFATGDEIREPSAPDAAAFTINSNAYALHGLIARLGCEPRYLGIVPDREVTLREVLAHAAAGGADMLLTTGGVSVGEEDHVKPAVAALGALHFWRIAIRPGRPLAFGRVGDVPFLGLPGNPVASWVTFLIFARPMLLRLAGAEATRPRRYTLPAAFSFRKRPGRREWLRGSLAEETHGRLMVHRFPNEGSGIFSSVVSSSGLIELPEALVEVRPGDPVAFLPFAELLG